MFTLTTGTILKSIALATVMIIASVGHGAAPTAQIIGPGCPVWADLSKPVQFVVAGVDPDNDLSYCDMGVDGPLVAQTWFSSTNSGTTITFDYTFTTPGTHEVWFQVFDRPHTTTPGIFCTVNVIAPPLNTNLSVMTYNLHLFEDSPVECIVKTSEFWTGGADWNDYVFEDWDRFLQLTNVLPQAADIIALEEVWAYGWRQAYIGMLGYPYSYLVDSSVSCRAGLQSVNLALPVNIDAIAPKELTFSADKDRRCNTIGNGLLLLSKYPLSKKFFARFPTYTQSPLQEAASSDVWADKGVLTATVDVGGTPVRVGISHALCGWDDYYSYWDNSIGIVRDTVTTFQDRKGQAYFFCFVSESTSGQICRFEDYSYSDAAGKAHHAVGWKPVFWTNMTYPCVAATTFQMNNVSYLFTVHPGATNTTRIWRLNDDATTGWGLPTLQQPLSPGATYKHVSSFQLNGQPYIALHEVGPVFPDTAVLLRINSDAAGWTKTGSAGGNQGERFVGMTAYEANGRPYLFVNLTNSGPDFFQAADIYQVQDDGRAAHISRLQESDPLNSTMWWSLFTPTAFTLNGRGFVFLHSKYARDGVIAEMDRSLISLDSVPSWNPDLASWAAVRSFKLNGHPYLLCLENCCQPQMDITQARRRPGEVFIWRVNDDGKGLEPMYQLEDMRYIRDYTLEDTGMGRQETPPAIMMGDFNIHANKYGFMNELFRKGGAVDAYVKVHGTAEGGETIDWFENPLMWYFWRTNDTTDVSGLKSRIDYVYVKQSGNGCLLEPVDAYVRQDWKIEGSPFDLSDHYPLFVKFHLREDSALQASLTDDGRCRLSITGKTGRNCEIQHSSDLVVWERLAELRLTNSSPQLYVPPERPPGSRCFYRLRLLP